MTFGFDAVILAGGRASRFGGRDKTALLHDGLSLLEVAVTAVAGARAIAVVGHGIEADDPRLRRTVEEPRWAGPVAAIVAGLRALDDAPEARTVVIAADLPFAVPAVARLLAVAGDADGAAEAATDGEGGEGVGGRRAVVAVDGDGREQPLLAVYPTAALRRAVETADRAGRANDRGPSLRAALAGIDVRSVALPEPLCADVDTPADAIRHGVHGPPLHRRTAAEAAAATDPAESARPERTRA